MLIIGIATKSSLFGLFLFFHIIGMLSLIVLLLSIFVHLFELIFSIKISNQKFLCNKKITTLQNIGIITFMLIVIFDLFLFGSEYIEPVFNNLKI